MLWEMVAFLMFCCWKVLQIAFARSFWVGWLATVCLGEGFFWSSVDDFVQQNMLFNDICFKHFLNIFGCRKPKGIPQNFTKPNVSLKI